MDLTSKGKGGKYLEKWDQMLCEIIKGAAFVQ